MTPEARDVTPSPGLTTVVAIDDNPANILLLQRALGRRGDLEILVESDGRRGLELVTARKPDLVLIDLHLPTMDGDSILQALQANSTTAEIPIVVVSGDATPETKRRVRELGAQHYLEKPFRIPMLLELVEQILGSAPSERS